jgi:GNAT superfamily N-acetyltransferase
LHGGRPTLACSSRCVLHVVVEFGGVVMTPLVMALPPEGRAAIAPWMARAFQDEPMYAAVFPGSRRRLDAVEAFMRWLYRVSLLDGAVVECTPSLDAVAVWEPPWQKYSLLTQVRAAPELLAWMRLADRGDLRRIFGLSARWDRRRRELVPEPHWRLAMLGVAPDRQRSGLGSVLLRHGVARADVMGSAVYTETGTQEKASLLCERLGFVVVEQTMDERLHFPVWRLLRRPSPSSLDTTTGAPDVPQRDL